MYSRITVAVDGSTHARKAFDRAIAMAEQFHSKLYIVHVISDSTFNSAEAADSIKDLKATGERLVEQYKRKAINHNLKVHALVEIGDPAKTIIKTANKYNTDLIVIGSRGLGLFKDLLLGSVSHKVSMHAKCPVMMVR